jgi:hypothetical protein
MARTICPGIGREQHNLMGWVRAPHTAGQKLATEHAEMLSHWHDFGFGVKVTDWKGQVHPVMKRKAAFWMNCSFWVLVGLQLGNQTGVVKLITNSMRAL